MSLKVAKSYNFKPLPGTRDYRGFFVQDTTYTLMEINEAGWAYICLDSAACYYVDPASIQDVGAD